MVRFDLTCPLGHEDFLDEGRHFLVVFERDCPLGHEDFFLVGDFLPDGFGGPFVGLEGVDFVGFLGVAEQVTLPPPADIPFGHASHRGMPVPD